MMKPILAACLSLSLIANSAERPPNIVFILADDLGWADTSLYGHTKFYRTPNIDRLAMRGMTFTNAYSAPRPIPLSSTASISISPTSPAPALRAVSSHHGNTRTSILIPMSPTSTSRIAWLRKQSHGWKKTRIARFS